MITNFDIATRYTFAFASNKRTNLNIDKAFVQLKLFSTVEENLDFFDSFMVLEWLCNQRPYIKTIKFINPNIRKRKTTLKKMRTKNIVTYLQIHLCCTLRRKSLKYLINFCEASFKLLQDKYFKVNGFIDKFLFHFSFLELDYFVIKPEYVPKLCSPVNFFFYLKPLEHSIIHLKKVAYFYLYRDIWLLLFCFYSLNFSITSCNPL